MEAFKDLLSPNALEALKERKNLLAFSAGVDSTALFFLLLEENIPFDMAIVDYGLRTQSTEEVAYAKTLANTYNKTLYHDSVTLEESNFEFHARNYRYAFFDSIIQDKGYDNLLTAHQLNDRLEWFLMQLSRGAGLVEMLGFEEISKRKEYTLIRPLIHTDKKTLLYYLHFHDKKYFVDESNLDTKYQRNHIRKQFSDDFITQFQTGLQKSFGYLQQDKEMLFEHQILYHDKELTLLKRGHSDIRSIDKVVKEMGYLLSAAQKEEVLRQKSSVIADQIVVCIEEHVIYIAPFYKDTMEKRFKEVCRKANIPTKIRPYLHKANIDPTDLQQIVQAFEKEVTVP